MKIQVNRKISMWKCGTQHSRNVRLSKNRSNYFIINSHQQFTNKRVFLWIDVWGWTCLWISL